MRTLRFVSILLAVSLAACAGRGERTTGTGTGTGAEGEGNRISSSAVPTRSGSSGIKGATLYFGFDSSQVSADDAALLDSWARYLVATPAARVTLQGHTDERGTPDYNVGLGERRAVAVRDALVSRGAKSEQLTVTSLGEERPVDPGHAEKAWRRNRRVEILD